MQDVSQKDAESYQETHQIQLIQVQLDVDRTEADITLSSMNNAQYNQNIRPIDCPRTCK